MSEAQTHDEQKETGEVILSKLERSELIKKGMKEGVDFGKIPNISGDFLWVGGAAKLAEEFGLIGIVRDYGLTEEVIDGRYHITVTLDMIDENEKVICTGIGTWDSGEPGGLRPMARQRGMAMAYKRAFVLGTRYATNSFGIFTQDDDIVRNVEKFEKQEDSNSWPGDNDPAPKKEFDKSQPFFPAELNADGVWVVTKGKHATKELEDVVRQDPGWINWAMGQENLSPEIRKAIEELS